MRDLQAVINDMQNDASAAFNGIADAGDILTVLDLAIDAEKLFGEPNLAFSTVLQKAMDAVRVARLSE